MEFMYKSLRIFSLAVDRNKLRSNLSRSRVLDSDIGNQDGMGGHKTADWNIRVNPGE